MVCKYEGAVVCGFGKKPANGDELGTRGGFLRAAGRGAPLGTTQQTVIVNKFFFVEQFFVEQFFVVGLGGVGAEFVEWGPPPIPPSLGRKRGVYPAFTVSRVRWLTARHGRRAGQPNW